MRRWILLMVVTVVSWGLASACSGDGGAPAGETPSPVTSSPGQPGSGSGTVVGGDGGGGGGGGEGDLVILPAPVISATIDGKAVVQDGVYGVAELKAHASDAGGHPTIFHWSLVGPGIAGGQFGDGADFSFKLPVVADKSIYELIVIGKLNGKAVQQVLSFFTVPKPTATIVANVNQVSGMPVALKDGGTVLKGQKILFSADAQFADTLKWVFQKDNGVAVSFDPSKPFNASDIGAYKILLMAFGVGGHTDTIEFKFTATENAVAIVVKGTVTKKDTAFSADFVSNGKYPQWSVLDIDASAIGEALESMTCTITSGNKTMVPVQQTAATYQFQFDGTGDYVAKCNYKLKTGYAAKPGDFLESVLGFTILPKAKAVATVDKQSCASNTLLFEVGKTVALSAQGSTGNVSDFGWTSLPGTVKEPTAVNTTLTLSTEGNYTLTLKATGIGDSDDVTCTIVAKALPNAVIADNATVKEGRSYIKDSFQNAHATVKSGTVSDFVWNLVNASGNVMQTKTTQKAADVFEFRLNEEGPLTLKLNPKFGTLAGPSNTRNFTSRPAQVSLITPISFSNIQSIAAVSDTDVYFASPSAIFHRGVDGRVVQVKNINDHPAQMDGFFARNAGDVYLLTTDGGFWRYTYAMGWAYKSFGIGANGLAISGTATGTDLVVVADTKRLYAGDASIGGWQVIAAGVRYLTTIGNTHYAAAATGSSTDPGIQKCTSSSCEGLKWAAGSALFSDVTWKAIGASTSTVYLSDANGRIQIIKNGEVAKFGALDKGDDYVVAFSRPATVLFAIGNKGGVYRFDDTGITKIYTSSATIAYASGVGNAFWFRDDVVPATPVMMQVKGANDQITLLAQKVIGTPQAPCVDQKRMWVVNDTAYVSVCNLNNNLPGYEVWSAPYQGDFTPVNNSEEAMPIVAIGPDDAGGLLIMRSDGVKSFVKQLKSDGAVQPLAITLAQGEVLTGMGDQFFITTLGIWVKSSGQFGFVQSVANAHHPVAVGGVLYYSYAGDTRLARYDVAQNKLDQLAKVADPIVDIKVGADNRVYVLTAKTLYFHNGTDLEKIYEPPAFMTDMAPMNGHHMLIAMGSKGLALVDLDKKVALTINPDIEVGAGIETWSVGYNGTEFLFFGRDLTTGTLILHQFGAPQ